MPNGIVSQTKINIKQNKWHSFKIQEFLKMELSKARATTR